MQKSSAWRLRTGSARFRSSFRALTVDFAASVA